MQHIRFFILAILFFGIQGAWAQGEIFSDEHYVEWSDVSESDCYQVSDDDALKNRAFLDIGETPISVYYKEASGKGSYPATQLARDGVPFDIHFDEKKWGKTKVLSVRVNDTTLNVFGRGYGVSEKGEYFSKKRDVDFTSKTLTVAGGKYLDDVVIRGPYVELWQDDDSPSPVYSGFLNSLYNVQSISPKFVGFDTKQVLKNPTKEELTQRELNPGKENLHSSLQIETVHVYPTIEDLYTQDFFADSSFEIDLGEAVLRVSEKSKLGIFSRYDRKKKTSINSIGWNVRNTSIEIGCATIILDHNFKVIGVKEATE